MTKVTSTLGSLAAFLVFLGALNWGLIGIFDYNVVEALFGTGTLTKTIYVVIGFFAVLWGFNHFAKSSE